MDMPRARYINRRNPILAILMLLFMMPAYALCQPAEGEEPAPLNTLAGGFESDLVSRYVWRGLAFSSGAVCQSTAWISAGKLTGSVWSNMDMNNSSEESLLNELDFILTSEFSFHNLGIEGSVQAYTYPYDPGWPYTVELSANLSFEMPVMTPFTVHTFDISEYPGAYFGELGLRFSRDLGKQLSMEVSAEIGWGSYAFNEAYIGAAQSALELCSLDAGLTWYPANFIYMTPHVGFTELIDGELRSTVEEPTLFLFGIALGGEF